MEQMVGSGELVKKRKNLSPEEKYEIFLEASRGPASACCRQVPQAGM